MSTVGLVLFWASLLLLVYVYVGYPTIMAAWASFTPKRDRRGVSEPTISILIVAHNERERIPDKIRNCLALDYPANRLEVVVASDGSSDGTADVANEFQSSGVRVVPFKVRRGKAAVLNELVPQLSGDVVVLADARQRIDSRALRALTARLADPEVGAVSGELMFDSSNGTVGSGVGLYWHYEKLIRRSESTVDSTIGATGALYAIRRALFQPIPADTILDDVLIPLRIARQGYRVVFEGNAKVFDQVATPRQEFSRKTRTIAGAFQLFGREPWLLNPFRNRLWFQTLSHKGLRLLLPVFHATAFFASVSLLQRGFLFRLAFGAQLLFYLAALAGPLPREPRLRRLVSVPYALCLMTWATVLGFVRFVRGLQPVTWEPTHAPESTPHHQMGGLWPNAIRPFSDRGTEDFHQERLP